MFMVNELSQYIPAQNKGELWATRCDFVGSSTIMCAGLFPSVSVVPSVDMNGAYVHINGAYVHLGLICSKVIPLFNGAS